MLEGAKGLKSSFCFLARGFEFPQGSAPLGLFGLLRLPVLDRPEAGAHRRWSDLSVVHDTSADSGAHLPPLVHNVNLPGSQQVGHRRNCFLLAV